MFAPRPVEGPTDAGRLTATVLSPTVDVSSPPAALRTVADTLPLAVLAAGLALVTTAATRRRTAPEPLARLDDAAPRRRPPRRGPPDLLV